MKFPAGAYFLFVSIFICAALCRGGAAEAVDPSQPVVMGYYPSWNSGLSPEKINYHLFTHIVHAFITPGKDGAIHAEGNLPSRTLTKLAHDAHVKALLAIGGEDSGAALSALTKNAKATDVFIKSVVRMAQEYGYDGIDVDWEYPDESDRDNIVHFLQMLRAELVAGNPGAMITMPVPATEFGSKWFDARLAREVDFIQIMSYELHGPWKNDDGTRYSHSGHNSPLYETDMDPIDGHKQSFQKFVDYWVAKGFPKNKMLIGIPCLGHGFAVDGWAKEPVRASGHVDVNYKDVKSLLAAGWVRHWDAQACVPWLSSPKGGEIISYDDTQSASAKGAWAKNAGLSGIFFWEISQDYVDGRNELVEAALKGMGSER